MTTAARAARRDSLRAVLEERDLDAIVLRRPLNFLWYTGGADNRVDHAAPTGVASIVVSRDGEHVLTDTIEARRFRGEVTPDIEVTEYPWYESPTGLLERMAPSPRRGADLPLVGEVDISSDIAPLRWVLDAEAIEQYRAVGRDAVSAIEEMAAQVRPGMTEWDVEGLLADACRRRAMYSPVVMVAADDRSLRYRHPVTVGATIRRRAMVVLCAERGGLYANLTRFVELEPRDAALEERMDLCRSILDRMREATVPGRTLGEIFDECQRFYAEAGYPDEWKLHHQGGSTGYASREVVAVPASPMRVQAGMAFAWNPSIQGGKAEETFVLLPSGPEVLAQAN